MNKRLTTMTLKTYIAREYIPYLEQKSTKGAYFRKALGVLNIICSYPVAEKKMSEIGFNDLELFFLQLEKQRKVKSSTLNRYRARLCAIYSYAIRGGVLRSNPLKEIKLKSEVSRDRCLDAAEVTRLLNSCKLSGNPELYLAVLIALNTGMHLGEILGLLVSNINGNHIRLAAHKTKSKAERSIPLNANIIKTFIALSQDKKADERLFVCSSFSKSFRKAVERANILDFHFHDLRRTFASGLLDVGVDVHVIQQILGHSSLRMTEVYLSSSLKKKLDAVEKLCFQ